MSTTPPPQENEGHGSAAASPSAPSVPADSTDLGDSPIFGDPSASAGVADAGTSAAQAASSQDSRTDDIHLVNGTHWFWGVLKHYGPVYRDVGMASLVINLLGLASPLFIMNVYDRIVPNNAITSLWVLALGVCMAYAMDSVLRVLRGHFVDLAGQKADVVLADMLMHKVLVARLDSQPKSMGALLNNLREFEQLREFFGSITLVALLDLPFLLVFLLLIFWLGGPLVILPIAALPIMLAFGYGVQLPFQSAAAAQFRQNMHKHSLLLEVINGIEAIKANVLYKQMQTRWSQVAKGSAASSAWSRRLGTMSATAVLFISQMINTAMIVWGVYLIGDGALSLGALIACSILMGRVLGPLAQLATLFSQWQKSRMALKALDMIMALPEEGAVGESLQAASSLSPSLSCEDVSFAYPTGTAQGGGPLAGAAPYVPVVHHCSLHINAGERVGIIGHTGSGKSTLARMLLGLYQPLEGRVCFGGVDIRHLDPHALRRRFGFMPQDNVLFYGSVYENIAMACQEDADDSTTKHDAAIARAAELAGVTSFVARHPQGFAMPVGERGLSLSGGQRQAVTLARALVRDPDVVVLDEPSSNLDMESERELIRRCKTVLAGKTVVLFTHRLSMLELVDRVIVLEAGSIVYDGPKEAAYTHKRPRQEGGQTSYAGVTGASVVSSPLSAPVASLMTGQRGIGSGYGGTQGEA